MCTKTSSCTVNEGRHFETVYVVAHEIGHRYKYILSLMSREEKTESTGKRVTWFFVDSLFGSHIYH